LRQSASVDIPITGVAAQTLPSLRQSSVVDLPDAVIRDPGGLQYYKKRMEEWEPLHLVPEQVQVKQPPPNIRFDDVFAPDVLPEEQERVKVPGKNIVPETPPAGLRKEIPPEEPSGAVGQPGEIPAGELAELKRLLGVGEGPTEGQGLETPIQGMISRDEEELLLLLAATCIGPATEANEEETEDALA
jgi:hypothetical protein